MITSFILTEVNVILTPTGNVEYATTIDDNVMRFANSEDFENWLKEYGSAQLQKYRS